MQSEIRQSAGNPTEISNKTTIKTTAIGYNAKAFGNQSTAIGAEAVANGEMNVAIGEGAQARKDETMALGYHTADFKLRKRVFRFRHDAVSFGDSAVSIGHLTLTGMPVKEKYKPATADTPERYYTELPTNSHIAHRSETTANDSKLYFQTSDGTVLLYESNLGYNTDEETGTYYKVKAVAVGNNDWKFVKVDANGNVTQDDNLAVKYIAKESTNKDVRNTTDGKVNHIDYFYIEGQESSTKVYPLDGGIYIGTFSFALGGRSLAVGLTSGAYGNKSMAMGLCQCVW